MKSSLLSSPIVTVVLLVSFGYLAISVSLSAVNRTSSDGGQEVLMQQVNDLMQEKKLLEEELAWTSTNEFVEQEARNKLYLVRSNETIVVYPEEAEVLAAKTQASSVTRQGVSGGGEAGHVGDWMELFGL